MFCGGNPVLQQFGLLLQVAPQLHCFFQSVLPVRGTCLTFLKHMHRKNLHTKIFLSIKIMLSIDTAWTKYALHCSNTVIFWCQKQFPWTLLITNTVPSSLVKSFSFYCINENRHDNAKAQSMLKDNNINKDKISQTFTVKINVKNNWCTTQSETITTDWI